MNDHLTDLKDKFQTQKLSPNHPLVLNSIQVEPKHQSSLQNLYVKKAQHIEKEIMTQNVRDIVTSKVLGQIHNDEKRINNRANTQKVLLKYQEYKQKELEIETKRKAKEHLRDQIRKFKHFH